jgi:arsenate reductase (glutaredoxin)
MEKITVYEKPTCTTCRNVSKILKENGVDFEKVNYYIDPFTKKQLKSLLKKGGLRPADILRGTEPVYKELKISEKNYSDDELIELMAKHPDLVQRPIVEKGDKVILARPADRINELFKG